MKKFYKKLPKEIKVAFYLLFASLCTLGVVYVQTGDGYEFTVAVKSTLSVSLINILTVFITQLRRKAREQNTGSEESITNGLTNWGKKKTGVGIGGVTTRDWQNLAIGDTALIGDGTNDIGIGREARPSAGFPLPETFVDGEHDVVVDNSAVDLGENAARGDRAIEGMKNIYARQRAREQNTAVFDKPRVNDIAANKQAA